jgi:hypothetical protein
MLKKLVLLFISLSYLLKLDAQLSPFDNQYFDSLVIIGEYKKAKKSKKYESILRKKGYLDLINVACVHSLCGDIDSSSKYLWEALNKGKIGSEILVDEDLENVRNSIRWSSIRDTIYKRCISNYKINIEMNFNVFIMGKKNTHLRNNYFRAKDILGDSSIYTLKAKTKSDNFDAKCENFLSNLIDSLGKWPGIAILDEKSVHVLVLFYQHSDCSFKAKFYPYISIAFVEKQITNSEYAMATDRLLSDCYGKSQIYGTQYIKNKEGNFVLEGNCIKEVINKNRVKIGLDEIK